MNAKHMMWPCVIGIGVVALLAASGAFSGSLATVALFLLCPVMMFIMMRSMHMGHHTDRDEPAKRDRQPTR